MVSGKITGGTAGRTLDGEIWGTETEGKEAKTDPRDAGVPPISLLRSVVGRPFFRPRPRATGERRWIGSPTRDVTVSIPVISLVG